MELYCSVLSWRQFGLKNRNESQLHQTKKSSIIECNLDIWDVFGIKRKESCQWLIWYSRRDICCCLSAVITETFFSINKETFIDILTLENINCYRRSSAMKIDVNEISSCFFVRCPSSLVVVLSTVVKRRRMALICLARLKATLYRWSILSH